MKKTGFLFLLSALAAVLSGQPGFKDFPKIKAVYSIGENGDTTSRTEYFYDGAGRCNRVYCDDPWLELGYSETTEYPDARTVIRTTVFSVDSSVQVVKYSLDDQGRAVYFSSVSGEYADSGRYLYNSAGFLLFPGDAGWPVMSDDELKKEGFCINDILKSEKGNLTVNGKGEGFTFYPDKPNTIGNRNMGIFYLGNDNRNLTREYKSPSGEDYILLNYSYECDSKGRAVKQVEETYRIITLYEYYD